MSKINHEDITDLTQYCSSFADQIRLMNETNPDLKHSKELIQCANGMVRVSKRIVDNKILGGDKVNNPISKDSVFWAQIVMTVLLLMIGISIGIGYIAIQNLESAVFHGDYSYQPKEIKDGR